MDAGPDDTDDRDDREFANDAREESRDHDLSAKPPGPGPGEAPFAPEPPPTLTPPPAPERPPTPEPPPTPLPSPSPEPPLSPTPEPPPSPTPPPDPLTGSAWHPSWPPESTPPRAHAGVPWEERDRIGFLTALFATIRLSLLEPTRFFSQLHPRGGTPPPPGGSVASPILYAILVGVPGALAGIFWQSVAASLGLFTGGDAGEALFTVSTSIIAAALSPILIPIALLLTTAVIHLFLLLFGGAREGFLASFRVLCYASAPELLQLIPICGIVSGIWWIVITGIGLQVVHRTTSPRAFGAVLMPAIACCGLILLLLLAGMTGFLDAME